MWAISHDCMHINGGDRDITLKVLHSIPCCWCFFLGNGCSHHFYLMINFNSCYYDGSYDKCKEEIWNMFREKLQILLYIMSLCIDAQSPTIIHCSIVVHSHSIVVAVHEWWADSDFFAFFFLLPRGRSRNNAVIKKKENIQNIIRL